MSFIQAVSMVSTQMNRLLRLQKSLCRLRMVHYGVPLIIIFTPTFVFLLLRSILPSRPRPLLWSTPRTGGFNNQLITIYQAMQCARVHRRTLVLPLIYENVRRDTSSKGIGPFPFEDYFDIDALRDIVQITTPKQLDNEGVPCNRIIFTSSSHFMANARRIPRLLKQNYTWRFPLVHKYVDRSSFPHHEACVDDSFCTSEEWNEFGPYSEYQVSGQGYNIRTSKQLLQIRRSIRPSRVVSDIAEFWYQALPKPFNAVHLRKGDFSLKCSELPHLCVEYGKFSFVQTGPVIRKRVSELNRPEIPLFISTTHAGIVKKELRSSGLVLFFIEDLALPSQHKWAAERTDILSFASQVLASRAEQFIGNRFSSFTTEINNMRYIRNTSDQIIFF